MSEGSPGESWRGLGGGVIFDVLGGAYVDDGM